MRKVLILAALLAAPVAQAQEDETQPPLLALYAGKNLSLNQDGAGTYSRGADTFVLRLVASAPGPYGLRAGFRGDLTSLAYLSPDSLDLEAVSTVEAYGSLSWSAKLNGISIGPAVFAGALIPVEEGAMTWRYKAGYGGGLRIGYLRSWAYVTVGQDKASDDAAGLTNSPMRVIAPFSVEVWRIAVQGEYVGGAGGRVRVAAVVRVPLPTWGN